MIRLLMFFGIAGGMVLSGFAQQQSDPDVGGQIVEGTEVGRASGPGLAELEGIFHEQLKARHIPLLGSYVTMLQSLAGDAVDPAPYEAEIEKVQSWIKEGGVVNLKMARKALGTEDKVAMPEPETPMQRLRRLGPQSRSWIVLTPDLARIIEPEPDPGELSSPEGVEAHKMEWRIELLPQGPYEVVMRYASAEGWDYETPVRVNFAGHRLDDEVPPVKKGKSKSTNTLRLAGLGRFHLIGDAEAEVLSLEVLGGADASIRVREVIIAPQSPMPRGPSDN